ncbi:hypothetical protein HOP50_02g14360 [Chloropicon primus]|nr:hypothetical protein A3770_02p14480 [Chloropicon primus]UPQ98138.1 hypothetical protein HOP50_02g14360 [Chloropicon primus]|eukprot:QDZ18930.1 hypothetical protein A3770_02p14480 [Chloropicon primus]
MLHGRGGRVVGLESPRVPPLSVRRSQRCCGRKGFFEWWKSSDEDASRFGEKAKEKMHQQQLEILRARKDKAKGAQNAERVKQRRAEVSKMMRKKPKRGDEKKEPRVQKYDEPENSIPIPMASFGIPKYDGGERFDLAAPYCDEGYVDEEADVMKKLLGFFKGGAKED